MAKKQEAKASEGSAAPRISLRGQFLKDLSFENPQAAKNLIAPPKEAPTTNINLDIVTSEIDAKDGAHEVSLDIQVNVKRNDETVFVAEVKYAGLFGVENMDDNTLEHALHVYAPSLLFPFTRRVIADVTRDGGYPPLLLEPIDFNSLYQRKKQQQAA